MRLANLRGRAVIVAGGLAIDVARASHGRFGPGLQSVFDSFDEFRQWEKEKTNSPGETFDPAELGAPSPEPQQVFAVALNYPAHAAESHVASTSEFPLIFTKYRSAITGPYTEVPLPPGNVDWEVELVAVIGRRAEHVHQFDAWSCVAGLTVGQDLSERTLQMLGAKPQFSLAKSYPGFAPLGPWLVTIDEFADPNDLGLGCTVDGEALQCARSSEQIFPVPELVSKLSDILPLLPGDVIFTGTPSGVGLGRRPQRFLKAGEVLTSYVEDIGEIRQTFVGDAARAN